MSNKRFTLARPSLSRREVEILELVWKGLSSKDIGMHLSISPKTVGYHRLHLGEKLGVHNTAELIRQALRNGLIKLSD